MCFTACPGCTSGPPGRLVMNAAETAIKIAITAVLNRFFNGLI